MAEKGPISEPARSTPRGYSRFANPRLVDSEGLVGCGGELAIDWLLDAYRHGIFPWPINDDEPMLWWSPDPRAVIELDGLRLSRRLRRTLRSGRFQVTADQEFRAVMHGCATGPGREEGTWLTDAMQSAYADLHDAGHAHSVEVWLEEDDDRRLVGGVYGVTIGGLFAAESMFHYESDASKVAVAWLVAHLRERGYRLLDIQQWTEHTGRMGAIEISRDDYLEKLAAVVDLDVTFGEQLEIGDTAW